MKRAVFFILLVSLTAASVIAQGSRTRQRVVRPPAITNDTPPQRGTRQAPKLDSTAVQPGTVNAAKPSSSAAASSDEDVITVDTNLVTTPVSVLDRNGRFIGGLTKRDFKIFEEGVQQKITYFQTEEKPFTVILMIDVSPSTKYKMDEIHWAAVTFVNQLRPNDKVMVVAFDQRARLLTPEPTNDKRELYSAIYGSRVGSGTSLYDAVQAVLDLDQLRVIGRKAVVVFTDGVDTTSRRSNFATTLAAAEEADALFYPIRYNTMDWTADTSMVSIPPGIPLPPGIIVRTGQGQSKAEYEKGRIYLDTLAFSSGGRMFEADTLTNLEAAFAGVAEELRRQYSVGYYPEDSGEPGQRRKIKIQVSRPNAVVRAKSSYVIKEPKSDPPPGT